MNLVVNALTRHHGRNDPSEEAFVPVITPTLPAYGGPRGTTNNPQFNDHAIVARSLRSQAQMAHREDMDELVIAIQDARDVVTKDQNGSGFSDDGVAYTLDGHATQGIAHPLRSNWRNNSNPATEAAMHVQQGMSVRRLTPTECERLQGFPDGWTEGESDSARYRMLGNAVAVPVAEWIGRQLMAHLRHAP